MGFSKRSNCDEDGFETWGVQKKPTTTSAEEEGIFVHDPSTASMGVMGRPGKRVLRTKGAPVSAEKNLRTAPEGGRRRRGRPPCRRDAEVQLTFVVSEEEYELLQALKKQPQSKGSEEGGHAQEGGCRSPTLGGQSCREEEKGSQRRSSLPFSQSLDKEVSGRRAFERPVEVIPDAVDMHSLAEPCVGHEGILQAEQKGGTSEADVHSQSNSDSDFQPLPKSHKVVRLRPNGNSCTADDGSGLRRGEDEVPTCKDGQERGGRVRSGRGNLSDEELLQCVEKEISRSMCQDLSGYFRKSKITRSPSASCMRGAHVSSKHTTVFPFEQSTDAHQIRNDSGQGPTNEDDSDDDFQDPCDRDWRLRKVTDSRALSKSELRATRKRKKAEREVAMMKREATGRKPFYIMVNSLGKPYGDGLTTWKTELNKLCRALDPSIRDVRQQPHQKMLLLKKRLTDNFEYSGVISDKHLLPLIGHRVSQRRNELINLIRAGKGRPSGVSPETWEKLTQISSSPNFQMKSAAMHYANSCRQNVGRTGPGGEIGVRESLKSILRRSPDPEEVQAEMTRDKGYGGKKNAEEVPLPRHSSTQNVRGNEGPNATERALQGNCLPRRCPVVEENSARSGQDNGNEAALKASELVKKLQADIQYLKARMERSGVEPCHVELQPPTELVANRPSRLPSETKT